MMDDEEVVELCEDFFNSLEGEEDYWIEVRGKNRPAFKLVDVEVARDVVTLVIEPAPSLDDDDPELRELLDRAITALGDEHEELSDYRVTFRLDTD